MPKQKTKLYKDLSRLSDAQKMFGVPLKIGSFSVKCPTVGDIIHYDGLDNEYGEVAYYQVLSNFCATPTDLWYELWTTSKIDYRELTDFQLFCMLHSQFTMRQTKVWFGEDVDFSRMVEILDENGRHVLIDPENNILVDELIYERIMSQLRKIHGIIPNRKLFANWETFNANVQAEYWDRMAKQNKPKEDSLLFIMLMTLLPFPGFKYDSKSVMDISIMELVYEFNQAQRFINSLAANIGIYNGTVEFSKIRKSLDWTYQPIKLDKRSEVKEMKK